MPAMPLLRRRSVLDLVPTKSYDARHFDDGEQTPRVLAPSLAPPSSPRPTSELAMTASRLSNDVSSADRPQSPPVQPENARTKRFSMLKFRNFSESHLSARAKEEAARQDDVPPVPSLTRGSWTWSRALLR